MKKLICLVTIFVAACANDPITPKDITYANYACDGHEGYSKIRIGNIYQKRYELLIQCADGMSASIWVDNK